MSDDATSSTGAGSSPSPSGRYSAAPAPAPATVPVADSHPEMIARGVARWMTDEVRGSAIAQNTEAWNAMGALVDSLQRILEEEFGHREKTPSPPA